MMGSYMHKYCVVAKQRIVVDTEEQFVSTEDDFSAFAKEAFKQRNAAYPKFFKMDSLSKLATLAAEYILDGEPTDGLALVLVNKSGSLDTDVKHQESIQDSDHFFPSPATFVYTLANICAGEISIRHQLQTENVFFVADQFPVTMVSTYADYLLVSGKAKRVLCGWIDFFQEKYEAVLYIVSPEGEKQHTEENISSLFRTLEG
ncbi:beta-ketoacyl-[acyl-carrier-protein] synthase family protein [Sphingobacterium bambusae]